MGTFIQVQIEADEITLEVAANLVKACPVDIFAMQDNRLVVVTENEDECTLCELCLNAAPAGAVTIRKTYKDETLVSTGSSLADES